MPSATLRSYCFLDSLQPQLAAFVSTTCTGFFPVPGMASLYVEIAPGMAIHELLDAALKASAAQPATIVVERAFGMLELHHEDKGQVLEAGDAVLSLLGVKVADRMKPQLVSNTVIRGIEPMHAMIIDKTRHGNMITPGDSLLIMETQPAAYISIAANEAEKAADVQLVEVRQFGAFGRLQMCGSEAQIDEAAKAATAAIEAIDGVSGK